MKLTEKQLNYLKKAICSYSKEQGEQSQTMKELVKLLGDYNFDNQKISIPLSDNDLQDLQGGETFDWTFDGIDVHLYQTNEDTE